MKSYQFLLEYRRDKTALNLGDKLVTAMSRDPSLVDMFKGKDLADIKTRLVNDPQFQEEVFSRFEAGDPTRNKQYTQWLINFYIRHAGNIRLEDISSTLKDLLDVYAVGITKNLVPAEFRDINRIRDVDTLEAVVSQVNTAISKSATTQPQVKQNAEEVLNDSQVRIIKPLDEAAACYYGQGTRWCTAAKNNNQFEYYNEDGPLYIIIPKKPEHPGEKYQLHSSQFMNEQDRPVKIGDLLKKYPSILTSKEIQATLIIKDPCAIEYIHNQSEAVQQLAVKQDGMAIQFIHNPSEEVKQLAVQQDGYAIHFIRNPSEAIQLLAVKENGYAIQFIRNPSETVKLLAVKENGRAIRFIHNPSEELKQLAVKQVGWAIEYIPNPSEAVQQLAVKQNGWAIRHIPNPSEAVQQLAVKQNGWAIEFIRNPSEAVKRIARGEDPEIKESMASLESTNIITRLRNLAGIQ